MYNEYPLTLFGLAFYLIEKVCQAQYGPGFVFLAAVCFIVAVIVVALTVDAIHARHVDFEKWKISKNIPQGN